MWEYCDPGIANSNREIPKLEIFQSIKFDPYLLINYGNYSPLMGCFVIPGRRDIHHPLMVITGNMGT